MRKYDPRDIDPVQLIRDLNDDEVYLDAVETYSSFQLQELVEEYTNSAGTAPDTADPKREVLRAYIARELQLVDRVTFGFYIEELIAEVNYLRPLVDQLLRHDHQNVLGTFTDRPRLP